MCDIIGKSPKSPNDWTNAFITMKTFLLSDVHISSSVKQLFQKDELSKEENKLGTKIVLWFIDKEIEKQAQNMVQKRIENANKSKVSSTLSAAAEAKLRYLAGACVKKITKRIKESVLRKIRKTSKKSRIHRKMEYRKPAMLKSFRIKQEDIEEGQQSLQEIEYKQRQTRGLTIVSESVFLFF